MRPIILLIGDIKSLSDSQKAISDTDYYKQSAVQAIDQFESTALEAQLNADLIYKVKYASVAVIDEMVVRHIKGIRQEWMMKPLQLEYFGEINSGEQFYQHLSEIRLQPQTSVDALEIYFFYLEIKFLGRYHSEKNPERIKLKDELFSQIHAIRPFEKRKLVNSKKNQIEKMPFQLMFNEKKILTIGLMVLVCSFLIFNGCISFKAKQYVQIIESHLID